MTTGRINLIIIFQFNLFCFSYFNNNRIHSNKTSFFNLNKLNFFPFFITPNNILQLTTFTTNNQTICLFLVVFLHCCFNLIIRWFTVSAYQVFHILQYTTYTSFTNPTQHTHPCKFHLFFSKWSLFANSFCYSKSNHWFIISFPFIISLFSFLLSFFFGISVCSFCCFVCACTHSINPKQGFCSVEAKRRFESTCTHTFYTQQQLNKQKKK